MYERGKEGRKEGRKGGETGYGKGREVSLEGGKGERREELVRKMAG